MNNGFCTFLFSSVSISILFHSDSVSKRTDLFLDFNSQHPSERVCEIMYDAIEFLFIICIKKQIRSQKYYSK